MRVVLSARVEADIARQLQYGIDHYGAAVAEKTFARVDTYLTRFLPTYPFTGKLVADRDLYETWIAKTPFIIFYRIDTENAVITVLALFHHAQDRASFDQEE